MDYDKDKIHDPVDEDSVRDEAEDLLLSDDPNKDDSDLVTQDESFIIDEALQLMDEGVDEKSRVDGKTILARAEGPTFFPDSKSRNDRFYPMKAWVDALDDPEFKRNMERRLVIGTIGHDLELDHEALRDGKWSHIVSRMWIDEKTKEGRAEYLIVNTSAGRELNTALRSGVKLYTSTRCTGKFKRGTRDVERLVIKGVDFVKDPGYLQADPSILESKEKPDDSQTNRVLEDMDLETQKQLEALQADVRQERDDRLAAGTQLKEANEKLTASEASAKELQEQLDKANQRIQAIEESRTEQSQAVLNSFNESNGLDAANFEEALVMANQTIETLSESKAKYDTIVEELGSYDDLVEHMSLFESLLDRCGSVEAILANQESMATIVEELGTPEQIREALEESAKFLESHGGSAQIVESLATLDRITQELGTEEQIQTALTESMAYFAEAKEAKENEVTQALSEELSVDYSTIQRLRSSGFSNYEIQEMFRTRVSSAVSESKQDDKSGDQDISEEAPRKPTTHLLNGRQVLNESKTQTKTPSVPAEDLNESAPKSTSSRLRSLLG